MRLFLRLSLVAACLVLLGRTASADYVIYYVTVTCDPEHRTARITTGVSLSEPVPPKPHEDRQANTDPTAVQSFDLQGGAGPGECHLTPDILVRAKVGEGRAMPYGQCGADPPVWLSLWADKRKWLSRLEIAGSCSANLVSEITVTPEQVKICTAPDPAMNNEGDTDPPARTVRAATEFPNVVDADEFPSNPDAPAAGTVAVEYAEDRTLCSSMVTKVNNDFGEADWRVDVPKDAEGKLFSDYQGGLYEYSGGFTRDVFDIDNSGTPRMVYGFHPSNHANDADMFFLSPGAAVDKAWPKISEKILYDTSAYIFPYSFGKCGDHSCGRGDEPEEGTLGFRHYAMEVRFRYLHETPFVWHGATYFLLNSMDGEAENIYAVLKPNPAGFDEACILNKVPENF